MWILAKDLRSLAEDESVPSDLRALAKALAEQYLYPVDFQVVDVEGELYAKGEANDMKLPYREVLEKGLRQRRD